MNTAGLFFLELLTLALVALVGHALGKYFARRWIKATDKEIAQRLAAAKEATEGRK